MSPRVPTEYDCGVAAKVWWYYYVFGWCRSSGPKEWRCLRVSQCILYIQSSREAGYLLCVHCRGASRTTQGMRWPQFSTRTSRAVAEHIYIYIGVRVIVLQEGLVCGGVGAAGKVWPRGKDARFGRGVKSWGTPTGKSPDYFTDCRRRPR